MKKTFALKLFLLVFIFLLFAGITMAFSAPTKVTIWNWSMDKKALYESESAKFMAANPDIQIEWVFYAQDQYDRLLPLAISSGNGPDLFWIRPEEFPQKYIQKDWIQPIQKWIDKKLIAQYDQRVFVEGTMYFKGKLFIQCLMKTDMLSLTE